MVTARQTQQIRQRDERWGLATEPDNAFGRENDLQAATALLRDPTCRLITITGPGGVGKTWLAHHVARCLADDFSAGIVSISLNAAQSPTSHHSQWSSLFNHLGNCNVLLVLDGFDQHIDESYLISEFLSQTDAPKIIITSRERLNLRMEWVVELRGLSTAARDLAHLENVDAIRFFLHYARMHTRGFGSQDVKQIWALCKRFHGLPLALELAASLARVFSLQEIAIQAGRSLDFLTTRLRDISEEHRSLRALFDQSWVLLSPADQVALRRLAVFDGTFTADAAVQVCDVSLATLSVLVDKSLLYRIQPNQYRVFELLHPFAAEYLHCAPDELHTLLALQHSYMMQSQAGEEADSFELPDLEALSIRELEVLRCLALGYSNQMIADELVIALGTAKTHVHNILYKLGVQRRSQAVLRARRLNLI